MLYMYLIWYRIYDVICINFRIIHVKFSLIGNLHLNITGAGWYVIFDSGKTENETEINIPVPCILILIWALVIAHDLLTSKTQSMWKSCCYLSKNY